MNENTRSNKRVHGLVGVAETMSIQLLWSVTLCVAIVGCSTPERRPAVPPYLTKDSVIPGMDGVRYYPRLEADRFVKDAIDAGDRLKASRLRRGLSEIPSKVNYLAISGGGDKGAFGAGLLAGWGESGTRPEFYVVTGISTGALIAPFAFLGEEYDSVLKEAYTEVSREDIFRTRSVYAALYDDALADTSPLREMIARQLTDEAIQRIAHEWTERGRWLLVATTDLDARRSVIWNMGAIAASGSPEAPTLFRNVLLASASIPGLFPPVMIEVEADGKAYQEMHVDGGAIVQTFFLHSAFASEIRKRGLITDLEKSLFVIRNATLEPEWASVERRTLSILGRAVTSLLQSQGIDDIFRIYLNAKTDGFDFNLAFVGREFDHKPPGPFDSEYMGALFDYGYRLARDGYPWQKTPPNFRESGPE